MEFIANMIVTYNISLSEFLCMVLILFWVAWEMVPFLAFKSRTEIFVVRKYFWQEKPYIAMFFTPIKIIKIWFLIGNKKKYFVNQMEELFSKLEHGVKYETATHDLIVKRLRKLKNRNMINLEESETGKKRRLVLEKIILLNFSIFKLAELMKKVREFRVEFSVK